jgi:nitrogenase-associated protein
MARIIFWGKLGCAGNARQLAVLRASGHDVEVRDLRAEPWAVARLRPFFGERPVAAWFNQSAPKVKRGEVRPETLSEAEALTLLIAEPLLIRRPLLACEDRVACGFDPAAITAWVGLKDESPVVGKGCPRPDMPPCPT